MPNQQKWIQKIFNPVDFCFEWTNGGEWYIWDRVSAHKEALKKRNEYAKELKKQGYKVSKFSLPGQLISRGGIGSGKSHLEFVVNCYGLNAFGGENVSSN